MTNYKSPYREQWKKDKEKDEMYNVDIHVWRQTGMGNSMQTITGNRVSILAALASLFETLIREKVLDEEDLQYALDLVSENVPTNNKN